MGKSKYAEWSTDVGLTKIRGWAQQGLSDVQIAHNIGISRSTLNKWKNEHSDISDTLKKGKEVVDLEVENTLLNLALGKVSSVKKTSKIVNYEDEVLRVKRWNWIQKHKGLEEYENYTEEELTNEAVMKVPTFEVVDMLQEENIQVPNVGAAIFWLKNRRPDLWRDKQVQELEGNINANVNNPFEGMSKAEIREIMRGE